jgi:hypothetical protein
MCDEYKMNFTDLRFFPCNNIVHHLGMLSIKIQVLRISVVCWKFI